MTTQTLLYFSNIRVVDSIKHNLHEDLCDQQRLIPTQSDQSLRWSHVPSTASGLSKCINENPCHTDWRYRRIWVFVCHTELVVDFVVRWLVFTRNIYICCWYELSVVIISAVNSVVFLSRYQNIFHQKMNNNILCPDLIQHFILIFLVANFLCSK